MSTWINKATVGKLLRPRFRRAEAEDRAASGLQAAPGTLPAPPGTDLIWRLRLVSEPFSAGEMVDPESGQRLGVDAALWHDSRAGGLRLRQAAGDGVGAPHHLSIDLADFGGSYLSLSVDLPAQALSGLSQAHILRMDAVIRLDLPLRVYARLNVRHGPNTEEILRDLPMSGQHPPEQPVVEFDLAATDLNEKRLEKIWLDLIFEQPQGRIMLGDFILSRHLRASF